MTGDWVTGDASASSTGGQSVAELVEAIRSHPLLSLPKHESNPLSGDGVTGNASASSATGQSGNRTIGC
jgi:hypothetical protein